MISIYLFTDGKEYVKIGKSKDIVRRRGEIQIGNPEKLYLYDCIESIDDAFETYLHGVCYKFRVKGEWFLFGVLNHLRQNEPLKNLFKNKLNTLID